jgi:hypothetical protein
MVELVKPCGCVETVEPGHVHTKMCYSHRQETFAPAQVAERSNLDLVGG